jgi:prepilin-type N-terminal cleavage/methylation domain-containing protein
MQALAKRASIAKKNNKGFSLVELIIVIAIMAVLVAILAPQMIKYVEKTRFQKDVSAISEVEESIRVSLADGPIYDSFATTASQTITITSGVNPYVSSPGSSALLTEVQKMVPAPITFVSNAYLAVTGGIVINVEVNATTGAITITKTAVTAP